MNTLTETSNCTLMIPRSAHPNSLVLNQRDFTKGGLQRTQGPRGGREAHGAQRRGAGPSAGPAQGPASEPWDKGGGFRCPRSQ